MNSRQRILNAIDHKPVDHPPLWLRFWPLGDVDRIPFEWKDQVKRAEYLLGRGIDDVLLLEPPLGYVENYTPEGLPGISVRIWRTADEEPLLVKEFLTPEGPLVISVRQTEDWPHGDDAFLFSDFNISRQTRPIIQDEADLRRLRYLLAPPTAGQVAEFRLQAEELRRQAARLGVALEGGLSALGDSVLWLLGHQRLLLAQMDEPDFIEALLDVLLQWELMRAELLCAEGIDLLTHMAWYEGSDFWSPRNFRRYLKPRLQQLVDLAHRHSVRFRYIITKGWKPIQQDLLELGIDCLTGVDPVQDQADLRGVKEKLGGRMCLMGGVNSAISLAQWDEARIRQAVDEAIQALGEGGGFILYPVDAIFSDFDWANVEVLIDQWKRYPTGDDRSAIRARSDNGGEPKK